MNTRLHLRAQCLQRSRIVAHTQHPTPPTATLSGRRSDLPTRTVPPTAALTGQCSASPDPQTSLPPRGVFHAQHKARLPRLGLGVLAVLTALSLFTALPAALANPNPNPNSSPNPKPAEPAAIGPGPITLPRPAEVRGTWITTTANDAISTPEKTAETMKRLADIGLNTVYVEVWKNGYTQYPSKVLERTIGIDRRPNLMPQDPSDTPESLKQKPRDLLAETLAEARKNNLRYIAWFEYGFMAAHKSTDNHLRRMKKEWLSLDQEGNEVAPNGFVWMNPLHPEARRFLLDLVLEAIDNYQLDGIQLDDRIVWPYVNMGYDAYTKKIYAQEHNGAEPPKDFKDPAWIRWRADKVNEYSRMFTDEIRKHRPNIIISLSPAVYPWVYDNYCLEWPKWGPWTITIPGTPALSDAAANDPRNVGVPRIYHAWDEFIPQVYRFSYEAFEKTWLDQVKWMNDLGAGRVHDMFAGIRVVGEGKDSPWEDVRRSIELVRKTGGGGHVLWFSRGVFLYEKELTDFYRQSK